MTEIKKDQRQLDSCRTIVKMATSILSNNLTVFGCVVNQTSLEKNYCKNTDLYTSDELWLSEIINNFTCFLKHHNAKGSACFESRVSATGSYADSKLKKLFYKIMTRGTKNYKAVDLQSKISGIKFKKKQENEAGLQLADFTVQPFLFNSAKEKQNKPTIYPILRNQRYGGSNNIGGMYSKKYGVVYIN